MVVTGGFGGAYDLRAPRAGFIGLPWLTSRSPIVVRRMRVVRLDLQGFLERGDGFIGAAEGTGGARPFAT
ncbi:MAG: hypothetical protein H6816_07000 [Phycisphaerales bacterium]|nr:hypothetical protein [Phycisphaerales bacterium]